MLNKRPKRSPLKAKPLRNPGQSLEQRRSDLVWDRLLMPVMAAAFLFVFSGVDYWRALNNVQPQPLLYFLVALLMLVYAAFRIGRALPELDSLRLAIDGERVVGQYLENLREMGYRVYHDVIGEGFNLDHVLIGPAGIFTVETKTYRKAAGPDVKVRVERDQVLVDGQRIDRDPIAQAKAQSSWLRELLAASTGRKFQVRPIILFPGWYVEQGVDATREVWVLNPKALPDFLRHANAMIQEDDIKLASFHLSRFIRGSTDT